LDQGKLAIGHVMAAAYDLLTPVWCTYPALDPAKGTDPLGLAHRETDL
jgi:hypothetical protein